MKTKVDTNFTKNSKFVYIDSLEVTLLHIQEKNATTYGDQPWDFFGGNDAEAETPVLWPPHAKS